MRYGLLGYPLGHSLSPEIHKRLFALGGREAEYSLLPISPGSFHSGLGEIWTLDGFNVTIPYKQEILPMLNSLHESAQIYQSVNTVLRQQDGSYRGFNTDCDGFLRTLTAQGIPLVGSVCVLGAGGVGRMFAIESARQGCSVSVAVREQGMDKARRLKQEIHEKLSRELRILPIEGALEPFDLLINATPVGMFPQTEACPVEKQAVAGMKAVFDCIYNPGETLLLQYAREAGVNTAGGMDMLVWQAAAAHTHWYGARFQEEEIKKLILAMEEGLKNRV